MMTAHRTHRTLRGIAAALGLAAVVAVPANAQQPRTVHVSLAEALQLAESRSEAVAVARVGLTRVTGQRFVTRSQGIPQLSGTGGYTKTLKSQFEGLSGPAPDPTGPASLCAPRIPANATQAQRDAAVAQATTCRSGSGFDLSGAGFGAKNQWQVGLNASYNVFTGGRIAGPTQAAVAQERSASIEVEAQRAQVKLDMAQAYFDAALNDKLVSIAAASLVQTEDLLKQTELGREVGDVSEFDVLRAQVTRDNQRPALIQARSNRDIAYLRLKPLLEMPLDDSRVLPEARWPRHKPHGWPAPAQRSSHVAPSSSISPGTKKAFPRKRPFPNPACSSSRPAPTVRSRRAILPSPDFACNS